MAAQRDERRLPERCDVVVIGSGFGGAVSACRRAQAGQSVVVLERGKRYEGQDFPRTVGQFAHAFWNPETGDGILDYQAYKNIDVIAGVGVGGGSLHYFNVNVPAPGTVFDRPGWPAGLDRSELDPYYSIAAEMLGSEELHVPLAERGLPLRTTVFETAAAAAGHEPVAVPLAVYTGDARPHPISGKPQLPCNYCGNCLLGCDRGSKNTLDHNYLALAEQHGALIAPGCTATVIRPDEGGGYTVDVLERVGSAEHRSSIKAQHVVVAAGTLGSTELLLRCRDEHRTLPNISDALGTRFSINGEFLLAYAEDVDEAVDPGIGPPITRMVQTQRNGNELCVQDLGIPDQLLWFLEGIAPPRWTRVRRVAKLAINYVRSLLRWPAAKTRVGLRLEALAAGARSPRAVPFLGMGSDSSDGVVRLRNGSLQIEWRAGRNKALYRDLQSVMSEISSGAGGSFVTSPLWRWPLRKVLTAHPLGGCPMGTDPTNGVVDEQGEAFGYPGLFVIDGSIIPAALAVNPSLTITAVAERCAHRHLHGADAGAPTSTSVTAPLNVKEARRI